MLMTLNESVARFVKGGKIPHNMKEDDKNLLSHTHKLNIWQQCQKIKETPSLFDIYALHFTPYTTSIVIVQRAFSSNIFSLIVGTFSPYFMTDPTVLMRDVYII